MRKLLSILGAALLAAGTLAQVGNVQAITAADATARGYVVGQSCLNGTAVPSVVWMIKDTGAKIYCDSGTELWAAVPGGAGSGDTAGAASSEQFSVTTFADTSGKNLRAVTGGPTVEAAGRLVQNAGPWDVTHPTYGAIRDDATDDNAAIQAAALAADTGTGGLGGVVFLPCGTYTLASTLEFYDGQTFQGGGRDCTIIEAASVTTMFAPIDPGVRTFDVKFRDMTIDGNGATTIFDFDNVSRSSYENVKVVDGVRCFWLHRTIGASSSVYNRFIDMEVNSCTTVAFDMDVAANENTFVGVKVGASGIGWDMEDTNRNVLLGGGCETCTTGVNIIETAGGAAGNYIGLAGFEATDTSVNIGAGVDATIINVPFWSTPNVANIVDAGTDTQVIAGPGGQMLLKNNVRTGLYWGDWASKPGVSNQFEGLLYVVTDSRNPGECAAGGGTNTVLCRTDGAGNWSEFGFHQQAAPPSALSLSANTDGEADSTINFFTRTDGEQMALHIGNTETRYCTGGASPVGTVCTDGAGECTGGDTCPDAGARYCIGGETAGQTVCTDGAGECTGSDTCPAAVANNRRLKLWVDDNTTGRVCVGGTEDGNPCNQDAQCPDGGYCDRTEGGLWISASSGVPDLVFGVGLTEVASWGESLAKFLIPTEAATGSTVNGAPIVSIPVAATTGNCLEAGAGNTAVDAGAPCGTGGGLADGDYNDIDVTGSGTVMNIKTGAVGGPEIADGTVGVNDIANGAIFGLNASDTTPPLTIDSGVIEGTTRTEIPTTTSFPTAVAGEGGTLWSYNVNGVSATRRLVLQESDASPTGTDDFSVFYQGPHTVDSTCAGQACDLQDSTAISCAYTGTDSSGGFVCAATPPGDMTVASYNPTGTDPIVDEAETLNADGDSNPYVRLNVGVIEFDLNGDGGTPDWQFSSTGVTQPAVPVPTKTYVDSDTSDGDNSATDTVNCTSTGTGAENCDRTWTAQIDGVDTDLIDFDSDSDDTGAATAPEIVLGSATIGVEIPDDTVDIGDLSATGTADGTTFLRGDGQWAAPPGGSGHTIEDEGTPLTARTGLNFTGAGVTCTDDAGNDETDCDIPGGGSSLPVADTTSIAEGSADATKEVRFEVDGITTGTVRVLTMPDQDIDLTPGTGSFATEAEGALATTALQDFSSGTDLDAAGAVIDDSHTHDTRYFTETEVQAGSCNSTTQKQYGVDTDGSPLCATDQNSGGGLADVVDDTTPQLGGELDLNGNALVTTANGDIDLTPNGTGEINLNAPVNVAGGGSAGSLLLNDADASHGHTFASPATITTSRTCTFEAGADASFIPDTCVGDGIDDVGYTSGGTDVVVADGGTGSSTASGARTNLGLVIGTDVQAFDADLTDLADGSLTGSKVGTGISGTNISTGTVADARIEASIARLASPTFTGNPLAPTPSAADSDTSLATTDFVQKEERTSCIEIEDLAAADDNFEIKMWTRAVTITKVGLHCAGTCTTGADISLEDRAGNAMTHTVPTHSTGTGSTTFQAVTAGNALVAGEGLRFDVDNAVSPETDTYLICVGWTH